MDKTLQQRIDDAFKIDGDNADQVRRDALEFCKLLREAWNDVTTSLNRTLVLMVAVAAMFILLDLDQAVKVTIGGIEFDHITIIQSILPALFAYLYLELLVSTVRYTNMKRLHRYALRVAFPGVYDNVLGEWLAPPSRAMFNLTKAADTAVGRRAAATTNYITMTIAICSFLLPLVFEVYAFWMLFAQKGFNGLVLASLVVSIALIASALTMAGAGISG
jgi:hypothetical protein